MASLNWLDFFASLVDSLAWPISAAIIALIFRNQIRLLFSRLEEFGYGEWKLKLRKDLDEAEQAAEALPPPPEPVADGDLVTIDYAPFDQFSQLVAISPNAAILDAWLEIERRLAPFAERFGVASQRPMNILRIIDALGQNAMIPETVVKLLHEMRQIRNLAVHSQKVSADDAYRFRKLSDRVMPFLRVDLLDQN